MAASEASWGALVSAQLHTSLAEAADAHGDGDDAAFVLRSIAESLQAAAAALAPKAPNLGAHGHWVVQQVCTQLLTQDIRAARCVCKLWNAALSDDEFWRKAGARRFGRRPHYQPMSWPRDAGAGEAASFTEKLIAWRDRQSAVIGLLRKQSQVNAMAQEIKQRVFINSCRQALAQAAILRLRGNTIRDSL